MKTVIFTDLDDSLFHSERSLRELGYTPSSMEIASLISEGLPVCYQTKQQAKMFDLLNQAEVVIPVTGRSSESLSRVINPKFVNYQIVSHGALILDPSGSPWTLWQQEIESELHKGAEALRALSEELSAWKISAELNRHDRERNVRLKLITDHGYPTYLSVKGPERLITPLATELRRTWSQGVIHHNRRDLAVLPSYASKARAVAFLLSYLKVELEEPILSIGLGDSLSDLPFLMECDFFITPRSSMIHTELRKSVTE